MSEMAEIQNRNPETTRPSSVRIATISNVPMPYRLHVQRRMHDELAGVEVHNLYTHPFASQLSPWTADLASELRLVHPQGYLTRHDRPLSWKGVKLFREIRDYLITQEIKLIILQGYNDLTRMLLIRWAKKAGIPLLLTSDSNVFSDAQTGGLTKVVKRMFVRWVLKNVAGLMPWGTCGRAF